jgi:anti-sigma regulatory factor (Ser/Thr protein kinase)
MRSWCAGGIGDGLLADAEVLVSELVTNALVHGGGRIILRACLDEDRLLVEVIDQHSELKRELGRSGVEQAGGWGLGIVEDISSRWGANEAMTHVWFELEQLRT